MIDPKKAEILIKEMGNQVEEADCIVDKPNDKLGQKIVDTIYEISGNDIPIKNAIKIFIAYEHGADSEHSVARVTGIDAWICKTVLDIFNKHELLNKDILNVHID